MQVLLRQLAPVALAALAAVSAGVSAQVSIQVLSSRADTITGGDVLVQISVPSDPAPLTTYYVKLNNVDITSMFRVVDAPANKTLQGLVTGLKLFTNTLNHPSNSCNPYVAGETTSMGKEHFIDAANQAQRTGPIVGRADVPGYAAAQWISVVPTALRQRGQHGDAARQRS